MRFIQANLTGIKKSFDFSGRASRSEFWNFAPLGAALPITTCVFAPPEISDFKTLISKFLVFIASAMPLSAAAHRRYQDAGLSGANLWIGLRPTLVTLFTGVLLIAGLASIFSVWNLAWGLIFFFGAIVPFLFNLFLVPTTLGETIGQLLVPSDPGSNKYGPNPHEVSQ